MRLKVFNADPNPGLSHQTILESLCIFPVYLTNSQSSTEWSLAKYIYNIVSNVKWEMISFDALFLDNMHEPLAASILRFLPVAAKSTSNAVFGIIEIIERCCHVFSPSGSHSIIKTVGNLYQGISPMTVHEKNIRR